MAARGNQSAIALCFSGKGFHFPPPEAARGISGLAALEPFQVAVLIKQLQGKLSAPTVKQHLTALRMLFDWMVIGHVIDVNPAHGV